MCYRVSGAYVKTSFNRLIQKRAEHWRNWVEHRHVEATETAIGRTVASLPRQGLNRCGAVRAFLMLAAAGMTAPLVAACSCYLPPGARIEVQTLEEVRESDGDEYFWTEVLSNVRSLAPPHAVTIRRHSIIVMHLLPEPRGAGLAIEMLVSNGVAYELPASVVRIHGGDLIWSGHLIQPKRTGIERFAVFFRPLITIRQHTKMSVSLTKQIRIECVGRAATRGDDTTAARPLEGDPK